MHIKIDTQNLHIKKTIIWIISNLVVGEDEFIAEIFSHNFFEKMIIFLILDNKKVKKRKTFVVNEIFCRYKGKFYAV